MGEDLRSHPFISPVSGNLVRMVESEDGHCNLETLSGVFLEWSRITVEILKLAEQGRALWEALSELCSVGRPLLKFYPEFVRAGIVLDQTAATFDQPEVARG